MPVASPDAYRWVDDPAQTAFAVAGCLTVIAGMSLDLALASIGADPGQLVATSDVAEGQGWIWLSGADSGDGLPETTALLIEDNGWEGTRPEVLSRLSRSGKAASVFWNVNGVVRFGCASRGKVLAMLGLPDQEDVHELPARVRRVLGAAMGDPSPVAVAMAMAQEFTGVQVPPTPGITNPLTVYPITSPLLGLCVTPDELVGLAYPSPAIVAAAQASSRTKLRELAEWAAGCAIDLADLSTQPELAAALEHLGKRRPIRMTAEANAFRRTADRWSRAANEALNNGDDGRRAGELRHWNAKYWAVEALAYLAAVDDTTAALGATYCASILFRGDENKHQEFLTTAEATLRA